MSFKKISLVFSILLFLVAFVFTGNAIAQLQYGVSRSTEKVFSGSSPGGAKAIDLVMARGEYEGVQLSLRPSSDVSAVLSPGILTNGNQETISSAETTLSKVDYVYISKPSTYVRAPKGYYPDPLIPINNESPISLSANTTQPIYVLFHIPQGANAGTYSGSLNVTAGSESISVPVTIKVINVSVENPRLKTCFPLDSNAILSVAGLPNYINQYPFKQILFLNYYKFLKKYWVCPDTLWPGTPYVEANGNMSFIWPDWPQLYGDSQGAPYLSNLLDSGKAESIVTATGLSVFEGEKLNFASTRLPLTPIFPRINGGSVWDVYGKDQSIVKNYLRQLISYYNNKGWLSKSYFWYADEPKLSECSRVKSLADLVHSVSSEIKFMLTEGPQTLDSSLWKSVDIWSVPLQYYYARINNLKSIRNYGAEVWGYNHSGPAQKYSPSFFIDKKLTEERIFGWFAYRENLTGILHWNANKWLDPYSSYKNYRDPYEEPLSYTNSSGTIWANGEANLIYPGFAPKKGLNDPTAGPNSSLRFEALRDGIEDYELLSILRDRGGSAYAKRVCDGLIKYRYGPYRTDQYINFPKYEDSPSALDYARKHVLHEIERIGNGSQEVKVVGRVVNKSSGRGVYLAKVSNGLLSTKTDKSGNYVLSGLIPQNGMAITVTHPEYRSVTVYTDTSEGAETSLQISVNEMRNDKMVRGFEDKILYTKWWKGSTPGSTVSLYTGKCTQGSKSLKGTFVRRDGYASVQGRLAVGYLDFSPFKSLDYDVYNPYAFKDYNNPWMLTTVLIDSNGNRSVMSHLLEPKDFSHVSFDFANGIKKSRSFNLKRVRVIQFLVNRPGKTLLNFDNIRLVPAKPRY